MELADLIVFGAVFALLLDFTVDYVDNGISRMCPRPVKPPDGRMIEVHDLWTLPLQK